MAITMQGSWNVQVKSKDSALEQRFVVQGSDNADGTYEGKVAAAAINVIGAHWSITIEHKPGGGDWLPSDDRISYPRRAGGQIVFDVRSNDSAPDRDYNDLVLRCSTTESPSEFIVYGRVTSYPKRCIFNPCFPYHFVIDTPVQLDELLGDRTARAVLSEAYPERIRDFQKSMPGMMDPLDDSDAEPFRPLMIPMPRTGVSTPVGIRPVIASPTLAQPTLARTPVMMAARPEIGVAVLPRITPSVIDLAKIRDRFRPFCRTKSQPGLLLRFSEYDRTAEELSGGPYSGEGVRKILGLTVTDELGNYIFRFSQTFEDIAEEFMTDVQSEGPPLATQVRPDIIVEVMGGTSPLGGVLFESALHSDIPNLKRVNLCIPENVLKPGLTACQGGRAIQSVGNIWTLPGHGNSLDAEGRITATHSTGPRITRGAWAGRLDVFACFLDRPDVKFYTIRFRRPGGPWSFVQETYRHIFIPKFGDPSDPAHKVGPFDQTLKVDGTAQTVPAYKNIESNANWVITHRIRKVQLRSHFYAPNADPGTVEFWIEGYDSAGNKVAGADDNINLFIDNRPISGDIESVSMGTVSPGECAYFEMPSANEPMTVRFKVIHSGGFVQSYNLSVLRGSGRGVPVSDTTAPIQPLSMAYAEASHGDVFLGTPDAVGPDGTGYVVAELQPSTGAWLPAGKDFCSFAFEIYGKRRITNGYTLDVSRRLDLELVGISYEPAS